MNPGASATTRNQQLLLVANGFFGALAAEGVVEFNPSIMDFEFAFGKAWRAWRCASVSEFPTFALGKNRFRDVLFRVSRSSSPFATYRDGIEMTPSGLTPREYLAIWAPEVTPEDWIALAQLYLSGRESNR
ncbi:hypothetical protein E3O45_03880 [Cryobacterium sp. TMS1-20-1]|uniref:Uncharacterized protein n=4 Tax=Cryobacterium TaxID=69578 RepID=A0A4R9AV65_9MICO|nr:MULTISPECIES: hypothetical protein [Cryobacterium]TFC79424.1 hypothetical protein E3O45_03880 [Cryobacterium sp. TMS1-20-1]TFD49389.1 hypothetical protein E3T46_13140 [Cryobacterium sp. Hh11]TFD56488.1 hypothetical protein E3T41_14900 [Cryobacterium sp. Hh38]TFD66321.1 hypothetical protein E3T47_07365 [Cryobacterium ruanii]TFD70620.1 hypothetical protein E3T50_08460 [Cryobacterium gelidum]